MRFRIKSPNVIHETVDNEVVIINIDSGAYYALDKTGAEIWTLIERNAAVGDIVGELAGRYSGERTHLERTVQQLLGELQEEGLISGSPAGEAPPGNGSHPHFDSSSPAKLPFEAPRLRKYTDLQDFILLDPVHEADEPLWQDAGPGVTQNPARPQ